MDSLFLISLSLSLSFSMSLSLEIKSSTTLDSIIRDYTLQSYTNNSFKTGKLYTINLPANLSGSVHADAIRLRCGSLQRYGASIKEFHLNKSINVHPCLERVILIRQRIESKNLSSLYYDDNALSGYELISPILTLTAYSLYGSNATTIDLGPITIDFSSVENKSKSNILLCASFGVDKKEVVLTKQVGDNVCGAAREGRFGVVREQGLMPLKGKVSKAKIVVVSSIAAALGAFLLSLLVVAMVVNAKKKARMDEMERRAYEEEALQVSMVGHVRAVTASGTRTAPTIEHYDYRVRHS
ncbi:hypothetical protein SASPL_133320 [Salvia splendens]|uniref:Transmembrane protein n=1 Tax=Salvia splendens TaxID=180675 RepID=A0A8X8X2H1_SALSN|nr:uncharacterized protein LOC121758104 [Salvia splendens]KAG6405726.1 hypothetical protein SASPL_133320 [Salvia splendens]